MVGDLRECIRLLNLFGSVPPKDFKAFNESEIREVHDAIISLLEQYSIVNKNNDIVGLFSVLSEINLYLNIIIIKHGGALVFREVNNATIQNILNKYKRADNERPTVVRDKNGQFVSIETIANYVPDIKVDEGEVDIRTQIDDILTKHNIFK